MYLDNPVEEIQKSVKKVIKEGFGESVNTNPSFTVTYCPETGRETRYSISLLIKSYTVEKDLLNHKIINSLF